MNDADGNNLVCGLYKHNGQSKSASDAPFFLTYLAPGAIIQLTASGVFPGAILVRWLTENMRIHSDGWLAKGFIQNNIGCFAANRKASSAHGLPEPHHHAGSATFARVYRFLALVLNKPMARI